MDSVRRYIIEINIIYLLGGGKKVMESSIKRGSIYRELNFEFFDFFFEFYFLKGIDYIYLVGFVGVCKIF